MERKASRVVTMRGRIRPRRAMLSSHTRAYHKRDALGRVIEREERAPAYMIRSGVTYRFITDNQDSVRLVVNATTGEIAQRLDYDSFGLVLRDTNPGFQPFGFQGGLYDPDTGLVEFGCRWYDAETGRWISKDPILLDGGWNVYAFCDNDPVNRMDPSGLCEDASWIDGFQALLDGAGVFDPTPACDGLNAFIYACRGKWTDAGISVVAMAPYVGDAAKGVKYAAKGAKKALKEANAGRELLVSDLRRAAKLQKRQNNLAGEKWGRRAKGKKYLQMEGITIRET